MTGSLSSCTKSCDRVEDLVCGFVPDEWLWVFVVVLDEAARRVVFQFSGGAMDAAPELFVGEQGKPAFDKVEPS